MGISVFPMPSSGGKTIKGQSFTANGNWTAPAGVNNVTVYAIGGGGASGGGGNSANGSNYNGSNAGGDTTFGTNLVVCKGGVAGTSFNSSANDVGGGRSGTANTGARGISGMNGSTTNQRTQFWLSAQADNGGVQQVTVPVTPGTSYAIAIGAGGTGGNFNCGDEFFYYGEGGSGFLSLTWEE